MALQDQLTRAERIRLESFSQSCVASSLTSTDRPTLQLVMDNALKIEKFLKEAPEDMKGSH